MSGEVTLYLDISTTNIGWCIANGNTYIESGAIKLAGKTAWLRMRNIPDVVVLLISKHGVTTVVAESPWRGPNAQTDALVRYAIGIVIGVCIDLGLRFATVTPQQIKNTKVSKIHLDNASNYTGKKSIGEDEADAVGAFLAYQRAATKRIHLEPKGEE